MVNTLNLKLSSFNGPIDLLDTLIRDHKMDILNLNIAALAAQYLAFVKKNIQEISIDDASEYLSMATYLLELKSKKILPLENEAANANFEYERDKLIKRIIEYRQYKETIPHLLKKQDIRLSMCGKTADDLESFASTNHVLEELPPQVDLAKLVRALETAFEKWHMALFTQQKIIVQEISVDDVEKDIIDFLSNIKHHQNVSFTNFLEQIDEIKISQQYIVTCFLALLELVKYRKINLTQKHFNDDIYISINNEKENKINQLKN